MLSIIPCAIGEIPLNPPFAKGGGVWMHGLIEELRISFLEHWIFLVGYWTFSSDAQIWSPHVGARHAVPTRGLPPMAG